MQAIASPQSPLIIIIQPDASVAARCATLAAAAGAEARCFVTAHAATTAVDEGRQTLVIADHRRAGRRGYEAIRAIRRRAPRAAWVVLTDVTPAFSQGYPSRAGIGAVVSRHPGWCVALAEVIGRVFGAAPSETLARALDDDSAATLADHLESAPPEVVARAVDVIALAADGAAVIEGLLDTPHGFLVLQTVDGTALSVLESVAADSSRPLSLRLIAVSRLRPGKALQARLRDDSPYVRYASAEIYLEHAVDADNVDVLSAIARMDAAPDLRARAAEALAVLVDETKLAGLIAGAPAAIADAARARVAARRRSAESLPEDHDARLVHFAQHGPADALLSALDAAPHSPRWFELAAERAPSRLNAVTSELSDPSRARAALLGATRRPAALRVLVEASSAPAEIRGAALRLLTKDPGFEGLLTAALQKGPDALRRAALLAAAQRPKVGLRLIVAVAKAESFAAPLRVVALELLASVAPAGQAASAIGSVLGTAEPRVASAAYRCATMVAGARAKALIDRGVSEPRLGHAIVEGAIELCEAGFGILHAVAAHRATAREVRLRAVRHLASSFPAADTKAWLPALRAELAPKVAHPHPVADTIRNRRAHGAGGTSGPTQPVAPSRLPGGDVSTQGQRPARGRRAAGTGPRDPARPAGTAQPTRRRGPDGRGRAAGSGPRAPASASNRGHGRSSGEAGRTSSSHAKQRRDPARPAGTAHPLGGASTKSRATGGAAERIRIASGHEARARTKLLAALDRGPDGFEALAALVATPSTPIDIRVTALRALVDGFDDERVLPILEQAMLTGPPKLQHAALAGATVLRGSRVQGIEAVARSGAHPVDVRLRAFRQLKSRLSKERLHPVIDTLLLDRSPTLREAALEALFPSLRHVPEGDVEEPLVNLLVEHPSTDVKADAAAALGIFGGRAAIPALVAHATGLLTKASLKAASRTALQRIVARDPGARTVIEAAGRRK